jgi:PAS domain S-box-containing protein
MQDRVNGQPGDAAQDEQMFRLLVQGVTDYGIYMLDPDGLIVNWNVGAERIKGYTAKEVIGRHFSMFYTPEDRAAGLAQKALEHSVRENISWSTDGAFAKMVRASSLLS